MELKLNTESISRIANSYIAIFLRSLKDTPKDLEYTFMNILLGFTYATKKLLNSLQVLDILTSDQVIEINRQLDLAAAKDVPKDEIVEILKNHVKEK